MPEGIVKNLQYYKFCLYGFFKNLRLFDAFLILFLLENGLSYTQIGALYAIREITLAVTEIPSGVIADALGRRRTLIGAFFLYIISFLIFYFSAGFFLFILAMLVYSMGDAFRSGVHKAMIFQYLKAHGWAEQKVNYYGHTRSWSQFGSAISALLAAGIVIYTGNYRSVFFYSVIPYLIDAILIYSYPRSLDGEKVPFQFAALKKAVIEVSISFFASFRKFYFIKVLTSASVYTGYYRAIKDYIQPMIKTFALSVPIFLALEGEQKTALVVGMVYFVSFLLNALASRTSGSLTSLFKSSFRPFNLTILTGFTLGILSGLGFYLGAYLMAIILFMLILAIENIRKPIGVGMIADLSREKALATVLSASSQAKSVIAALLAPLVGLLADQLGPGLAISIVAGGLILLLPFYWLKK
jgi:MFS family permease